MFGIGSSGSVDPMYPISTMFGKLIKMFHAKLALCALGVSPSSQQANSNEKHPRASSRISRRKRPEWVRS